VLVLRHAFLFLGLRFSPLPPFCLVASTAFFGKNFVSFLKRHLTFEISCRTVWQTAVPYYLLHCSSSGCLGFFLFSSFCLVASTFFFL
jgi:hypothetical protein